MKNEFADNLDRHIMSEYWKSVENRVYPLISGVWEMRNSLPVTWKDGFETPSGEKPLEIPLVGGGYMRFGRTPSEELFLDIDVYFPMANGKMMESGGIVSQENAKDDHYGFWVYFDDSRDIRQTEYIKFLARLDPNRDVDWERLQQGTDEMTVALALCKNFDKDMPSKF